MSDRINFNTARILELMKSVGGCIQRREKAKQVLEELKGMLLTGEYQQVVTAVGHYQTGEGREELDRVCNRLIQKYRGNPPTRTSMVCL